ncbi:hypothetical protein WICPIJ_003430 [Wickerhamomyces pijperi]|uniref:Elongation factor 1 alpha-like protein n=1 Tax=Wickerhamomyces pijperi TaxID=599730 RepID=A0A9P8Q9V0_WICPI|nr:hypothetical protein WICPIJ_003430 [Wickerhamomyces pijperi]
MSGSDTEGKPLSKLQILARARAQKNSEQAAVDSSVGSVSILDSLKRNRLSNETPSSASSSSASSANTGLGKLASLRSSTSSGSTKSISILDSLRQKKEGPGSASTSTATLLQSDAKKKPMTKLQELAASKAQRSNSINNKPLKSVATSTPASPQSEKPVNPQSASSLASTEASHITNDKTTPLTFADLIPKPLAASATATFFQNINPISSFSALFAISIPTKPSSYKRKLKELNLNTVNFPDTNIPLAKKIKTNFNSASPDDIALKAQSQSQSQSKQKAKEEEVKLSEAVSSLKITPKSVTKPKFKTDIQAELLKRKTKPNTSFVIIGHVDAGKSTLTGRLLLDQKIVDKNTYTKLQREAEKQGKGSFSLAWVMDQSPEERSRGVTIDICSTQFATPNANFTIVDAPGHRDFIPNMITGVAQSDIAVLVVDSSVNAFEAGFNLDGQTKEHTVLARSLGIEKIVVAVNKMDNVDWSEARFEEIKGQFTEFLKMVGYKEDQCSFVPCSGLSGLNVSQRPQVGSADERRLNWYHGGPSLLEVLEQSDKFERDVDLPFVLSVSEINQSNSEFSGRVETGMIQVGETVSFAPSGQYGVVDSIKLNETLDSSRIAIAGDTATIKVRNITVEEILPGDLMTVVSNEIPIGDKFESKLVLFDLKKPVLLGMQFVLFRGNTQQPAKISKIISLFDKVTGEVSSKKKPKHLSSKQTAIVEIELVGRKIPLQLFKDNKHLGRFVLRKDGDTIGAGVVEKI